METRYIEIPSKKWGVLVVWDFDLLDYDELAAIMDSFGMKERNINKALRILSNFNTGMAISRPELKMSTVFVSNATSASEFWNTVIHEFIHVADSILEYYDTSWSGETAAYLVGYLAKEFCEISGYPYVYE